VGSGPQAEAEVFKHRYLVFGTVLEVLVAIPPERQASLENSLLNVERKLNAMHRQWHAWKPGRLQEINTALRAGKSIVLTDEELALLRQAQALSLTSQGFFDPAVGELVHLWGFHTDEFPLRSPPPSDERIDDWLAHRPTMGDLRFDGRRLWSENPRLWLDFGGLAKGWAVDVVKSMLKKDGFENIIINAGGDVLVSGNKRNKPWKVAIRAPGGAWPGPVVAVIHSRGQEAVFTSGNYQRYKEFNGTRYAHVLNPFTGRPVPDVASVTVIAKNGWLADAAATAIMVAGWRRWPDVASGLGIHQVLMLGERGRCEVTSAMLTRLTDTSLECTIRETHVQTGGERGLAPTQAQTHESTGH